MGKKKIFLVFVNSLQILPHLTNIIPIPIRKFWNSQTIPNPICKEVGFANLFLLAGKITFR